MAGMNCLVERADGQTELALCLPAYPGVHLLAAEYTPMHSDLDCEAVQERSDAPCGGVRVGAAKLSGLHPVHDHGGNRLLPEQVEAPGHRPQLRLAEGSTPG